MEIKKGVGLTVIALFVFGLIAILPVAIGSIPTEIEGRPYYFNDYDRKSSTTTPGAFGQVMNWGNIGIIGGWYNSGFIFATSHPSGGPYYIPGVFDCGEWAAYHEWLFEGMGFDTRIVTGAGHGWVEVLLSDGQWHDFEPFEYEMGCMDYHSAGTVVGYDIYDFKDEYGESEVNWWAHTFGQDKAALAINGMPDKPIYPIEDYGIFRNGVWYMDTNGDQIADESFCFGIAGDTPITCGSNYGIFRNGYWAWETGETFSFGIAGDKPFVFDNGDYGVFRNGVWYMDTNGDQIADESFCFGIAGDTPITCGSNYGIFRNGYWAWETGETFSFGIAGDNQVIFDNGDYGVFRNGVWYMDTNGDQIVDESFSFGIAGDIPV